MSIDITTLALAKEYTNRMVGSGGTGSSVDGGYYTPGVTQPTADTMQISFAPSKSDMPAVDPVTVNLPVSENSGQNVAQMEPMEDDIPKVFFTGTTPTTKAEDELPLTIEYISKTRRFFAYVTLKVQGDTSAGYPLKNFNMKMFGDEARSEKLKMQFRNWVAKTHKYCLKKNWVDILNARNVVNGRLWGQVVRTRSDFASYPAEYQESSNCGAVDGFPIKVYVNGVYQGLYTWNIRKDDSMFNMDDGTGTHAALIADTANDATLWRKLPKVNGTDWTDELNDTVPDAVLAGFQAAYTFVMTATDEEFKANIEQYFYKSSLIDYYCFIYAILMKGGLAKSQTMFTYDAQKFLANIYDMDTTWALLWNGVGRYPVDTPCPEGYEHQTSESGLNLLYERLVACFPDEVRERYFELRKGPLSESNIINEFERFTDPLVAADLYTEEYASTTAGGVATDRPSKTSNTIQELRQIIHDRLAYCDLEIAKIRTPVAATSVTLSASTLSFVRRDSQTLTATVEPSDTTDAVVWTSDNEEVATVADGVVTPVADGTAIIIATAGSVSAECAVTVALANVPCTGITLEPTEINPDAAGKYEIVATVTPEDTTDEIVWSSSNEEVATVAGGIVTVRGNGTATITATCGSHSATCEVNADAISLYPLPDLKSGILTVSNTNHLAFDSNGNANFGAINANLYTGLATYTDPVFTLNDGDAVVLEIKNYRKGEADTTANRHQIMLKNMSGLNIIKCTATEDTSVTKTISGEVGVGDIRIFQVATSNGSVHDEEFDIGLTVNGVRYI